MRLRAVKRGVWALVAAALIAGAGASTAAAKPDRLAHASIIGGRTADLSQYGFTVAVIRQGRLFCTGSVINSTHVLTAGHCASGVPASDLQVLTGRIRVGDNGTGEAIGVTAATVDPDFGVPPLHDLAVLTLAAPTSVNPIRIAAPAEDPFLTPVGAQLGAAGYGQRNPLIIGPQKVGVLTQITQQIRTRCTAELGPLFVVASNICALGSRIKRAPLNRGVCFGDSGGPLVAFTPTGPVQVGVASQVTGIPLGCGLGGAPNVYARTSATDDYSFIRSTAGIGPPEPRLVSFAGLPLLKAQSHVAFPVTCSAACTVTGTMDVIFPRTETGPLPFTAALGANATGDVAVDLRKKATRELRTLPGQSVLKVELDATGPSFSGTDTHVRFFGFSR